MSHTPGYISLRAQRLNNLHNRLFDRFYHEWPEARFRFTLDEPVSYTPIIEGFQLTVVLPGLSLGFHRAWSDYEEAEAWATLEEDITSVVRAVPRRPVIGE